MPHPRLPVGTPVQLLVPFTWGQVTLAPGTVGLVVDAPREWCALLPGWYAIHFEPCGPDAAPAPLLEHEVQPLD